MFVGRARNHKKRKWWIDELVMLGRRCDVKSLREKGGFIYFMEKDKQSERGLRTRSLKSTCTLKGLQG